MKAIKRKGDFLTKEKREALIREVATYFKTEQDVDLGMITAEDILDFFLAELGDDIYNKGIKDSRLVIKNNLENLEVDLDLLVNK